MRAASLYLGLLATLLIVACSQTVPTGDRQPRNVSLDVRVDVSAFSIIDQVVVEVTGPGMATPLVFNLTITDGVASGTITVLTGAQRTITVTAFDAAGIATHRGSVVVDVVEGDNPVASVTLIGLQGDQPIEAHIGTLIVSVDPSADTLNIGDTLRLRATVVGGANDTLDVQVRWATLNPALAWVDTAGLVTALGLGDVTIVATYAGVGASAEVTVAPAAVASVEVSPASADILPAGTVQLSATLRDSAGNELAERQLAWSSDASDIADVSQGGLVTGVSAGTATITATSEGRSGTASITVLEPSEVLLGAGDIASCGSSNDEATAAILDTIPGTVFTAGDNAYPDGTASDFADCYGPSWGRHKDRTRPTPGNHDYHTPDASGYFGYFGTSAGEPGKGYYSYDLGAWHIIALNSEISMSAGSPQEQWLRADLAAATERCTLAYMHRPRFSSSSNHGSQSNTGPLFQALYDAGAEIIVGGHDHVYERFAPQAPDGAADPTGVRQFVVGTGGASLYSFGAALPNSEVRYSDTPGVLKFTLHADSYDWEFIPISGSFRDSESDTCH